MRAASKMGLALLGGLGLLAPAVADVHPNTQGGFPPEQAFSVGEIDNVNLFNGALVLTVPIGQAYPVSSHFSYRLSLVYNHNAWEFVTYNPGPGLPDVTQGIPNRCSNAGLGWRLSLGSLNPACVAAQLSVAGNGSSIYVGPDGAEHIFYMKLHEGDADDPGDTEQQQSVLYTRDGSYLRLRKLSAAVAEIDFPDGTVHVFESGRLKQMRDPFNNQVNVQYLAATTSPPSPPQWVITDSRGRTHRVILRTDLPSFPEAVDRVVLEGFGTQTATYTFSYEVHSLGRGCPHNDKNVGPTMVVPLLVAVGLPDGSAYRMPAADHITAPPSAAGCTDNSGSLLGLSLPTLGRLEWTYQTYRFPNDSSQQGWRTRKPGVASRTMRDPGGAVLGTGTYGTETIPPTAPYRALKNTVINPLGQKTERYFSVATDLALSGWSRYDYALPFTRDVTHGGLLLSARTYEAGGQLLRSEYVRYERDQVMWAVGAPDAQNSNRRVQASRTVFNDDPGIWSDTAFYEFDGLGHYRNQQVSGTFPGSNFRARYEAFNLAQGTYSVDPASNTTAPGFTMKPASQPWVLAAPSHDWDFENGAYSWRDRCYQPGTQVETRRRTHRLDGAAQSETDLVAEHVLSGAGDVIQEKHFGGDAQKGIPFGDLCTMSLPVMPEVQLTHTYANGVLATSEYTGTGFKILDRTIDRTGLPSSSRDSAGIGTSYEYDALGRLTWSKPDLGHGGWTQYLYGAAEPFRQTRAGVVIRRRGNGSQSAPILQTSQLTFDFFGRVFREQQSLPGGGFNLRETLYDAAGNKESVSEVQSGSISRRTFFLGYDPFGRPRTLRPPDGMGHDVVLHYKGTRQVERTVKVAAGAGGAEIPSTTTEIYDRHGRLLHVLEPSGAGAATTTTTYDYDVNHKLARVTMSDGSTTQTRTFHYDRAGLLSWEIHPEKGGPSGYGTTSYPRYDSQGKVLQKIDGPSDLTYFYDAAERLYWVRETGGAQRTFKTFTYANANSPNNHRRGKLHQQSRFNYTSTGATPFTVELRETFTYGGRDGRVSARKLESFVNGALAPSESFDFAGLNYDPLGNLLQFNYPSCLHAGCAPAPRTVLNTYTEGLLTSVGMPGVPGYYASAITYHPNLQIHQVVRGNGLTDTQANDPNSMGRPASITVTAPGGAVRWATGAYSYDGAGNVRSIGSHSFTYDKVSRLKSANLYLEPTTSATLVTQTFTYDAFGNLQSIAGNAGRTTPTSSSTNRLTGAGTAYDTAGNLTSWNSNLYEYDPFQMMSRYKTPTDEWIYLYTADDERAWTYKIGGTESRWTLRGLGGQLLREYVYTSPSTGWTVASDSIYRGGLLLASEMSSGIRHFHLDHLGTPRLITDGMGQQAAYHVYYPYGEEATSFSQDTIRNKFTGHERDLGNPWGAGDDLDYMHARHCSPVVGRFLSPDPMMGESSQTQSWNRYMYAWGNPLKWIDPTGEVVSLASISGDQRAELLKRLEQFTGNKYGVDKSLNLVLLEIGASSSKTAAGFLNDVIGSETMYTVRETSGKSHGDFDTKDVFVNFQSFEGANYGKVDPRTFNLGSTLVHELIHAVTGQEDTTNGVFRNSVDWTGPVVDFENKMRAERGLPLRQAYGTEPTIFGNREKVRFNRVNPRKPDKVYYVVRNKVKDR